jgi:hypothetical protein
MRLAEQAYDDRIGPEIEGRRERFDLELVLQIRGYCEHVESLPAERVNDESPLMFKQVIIGDEEFAEQVLKKRSSDIVVEGTRYINRCEKNGMPGLLGIDGGRLRLNRQD